MQKLQPGTRNPMSATKILEGSGATTAATRGLAILIVEDRVDCAESMAMLLRLLGHEAEICRNGASAILAVHRNHFDVILLDIGLPGGPDGWEVAKQIKEM